MYGILKSSTNTGLNSEILSPFVAPMTVASKIVGYTQDTINLKRLVSSTSAQRWEITTNIMPTNDSAEWFVQNITKNFTNKYYLRMPQIYGISLTPVGSSSNYKPTLTLANTYAAGTEYLSVNGLGLFNLAKGEFIQFATHTKVYTIVDKGTNGSNFKIFPPLKSGLLANTEMYYGNKVTLNAYLNMDNVSNITYTDGIMTDPGTLTFVEAV